MSTLLDQAGDYLRLRRALGHKLDQAHRLLPDFVAYLDAIGAQTVTVEGGARMGSTTPCLPATSVWARRMTVARGFACHMTGVDPDTEIPPLGLVRFRQRRRPPFIYSDADITALMSAARRADPHPAAGSATVETIIGLLAADGRAGRRGHRGTPAGATLDTAEGVIALQPRRSSGSPAWSPSTPAPSPPWAPTPRCGTGSCPDRPARPSSSRPPAPGSSTRTSARRSAGCSR